MKKSQWTTAVQLHEKELREKYMSLFGNEAEFTKLLDTMESYFEKRSDVLKKLGNAVACIPETGIMYLLESYYDKETGVTAEAMGEMDFLHY